MDNIYLKWRDGRMITDNINIDMVKKEQTYEEWYASCQPINWPEETTKLFSSGDTFSEKDVKAKND